MNLIGQALARIIALSMLSALPAYGANSAAPRGVPPTIHTVSPSQLATSSNTALINISGSSFDPGARVELMFDVGPGAGKWSLPRHGFQVLSASQIQLTVMPGPDNDQLRIRVVSAQGTSNLASVKIVKPTPAQSATPQSTVAPANQGSKSSTLDARTSTPQAASGSPSYGANSAAPRGVPPTIRTVSPSQLATSSNTTLINISGSSFDPGARVELMFDAGSGAGRWSLPRHGFQVLSTSQIRLTVMPGPDNDQLRIRIVNDQGVSNIASVSIIKPAPPTLPNSSVGPTAVSTPQTLPPPRVSVCGNKKWGSDQWATQVLKITAGSRDIELACSAHDTCYARPAGIDSKDSCDGKFDAEMGAACNRVFTTILRKECELVRTAFMLGVLSVGGSSYEKAQTEAKARVGSSISSVNSPGITNPAATTFQAATSTLPPKIFSISPTSLVVSNLQQTIVINGSGFDKDTRVEWMYGMGSGAGEWRTPRNIPEVLNSGQIRVAMQSGKEPDRMQIRVLTKQGYSNVVSYSILFNSTSAVGGSTTRRSSPTPNSTPLIAPKATSGLVPATIPVPTPAAPSPISAAAPPTKPAPSPTPSSGLLPAPQQLLDNAKNSSILKKLPAPTLTRIAPASGAPGITLALYGNELSPAGAVVGPKVVFNTRPAISHQAARVVSNNELRVTVPAGNGSVTFYVDTAGGKSGVFTFTYRAPVITGISPSSGGRGQLVTITGENFGVKQALDPSDLVKFGDSLANPILQWEDRKIVVKAPTDFGTGNNGDIIFDLGGCLSGLGAASEGAKLILKYAVPGCNDLVKDLWKKYKLTTNPGFLERRVPVLVRTAAGTNNQGAFTYKVQTQAR